MDDLKRRPPDDSNLAPAVVEDFGAEWSRFDQQALGASEAEALFQAYFATFPWDGLPPEPVGFDLGCGSGRWARLVAPRVGTLHCIDAAADALAVARSNLAGLPNCRFHLASVDAIPLEDESMDFGYSLGVLHHVPDTAAGIRSCARKLKPGAPFLVYLYYRFDNRPAWFRAVWRASDLLRRVTSALPRPLKHLACDAIALTVYWPLARLAWLAQRLGLDVRHLPLAAYADRSLYVLRTDALDRFGTRLEQRFTRKEIEAMLQAAGLRDVRFGESAPYWCAVATKPPAAPASPEGTR